MRQIPNITKNLLIINIICYMAKMVLAGRINFDNVFGLHFFLAEDFHIHQLLTYMFMHANFTHLFFNMFALWMFGGTVERTFGEKRFLIYYIICGLGAAICQDISIRTDICNVTFRSDNRADVPFELCRQDGS